MISNDISIQNYYMLIENKLNQLVQEQNVPFNQLFSAARYSLIGAGKRLRPILTIATAEIFGTHSEKALNAACALEMIHAYSLIHDDLPCMDDDDFRRGKPSLHKAFPESHAVLAGDYLLTYAFEVIAIDEHLTSTQRVKLITILAKNAGAEGMIAGQLMDIEAEGKKIDLETLRTIHRYKTGALITAAVAMGGIVANVVEEVQSILISFGKDIGLAFQIIDDVLDVTESQQKHGRNISSDILNDKVTYVQLLGLEKAKQTAFALVEAAKLKLRQLPQDTSLLEHIADTVIRRTN